MIALLALLCLMLAGPAVAQSLPNIILQSPTATLPVISTDVIPLVRNGVLMHQSPLSIPLTGLPSEISNSPLAAAPLLLTDVIPVIRGGVLTHQSPLTVLTSHPPTWSPVVHQNAGGSCYGDMLCWGNQNMDLIADHLTIQTNDPSLITYAAPSGTYVAGEKPGLSWKIGGTTYLIRALVHAGDTNFTFATRLGICLGHAPNGDCDISPASPTVTAALLALNPPATISGPGENPPSPVSGADVRIPFDVPFDGAGSTTCPTALNSASTTITVTGCAQLDNGPYMATARFVLGHSAVGDQLGGWRADGAASAASIGIDTTYVALYPFVLSPNASNPQGELMVATASATSGRAAQASLYIGNGIVTAAADGSNCGYRGRGNVLLCGNFGVVGKIAAVGPTPSITSGFGTSASLVGSDVAGRITVGTGGAGSGVITFAVPWAAPPPCSTFNETANQPVRGTPTMTTLTFTGTMAAGDKIGWLCVSYL